jgi:hypothetical protein
VEVEVSGFNLNHTVGIILMAGVRLEAIGVLYWQSMTLTPANTIRATATSHVAVRLCTFFACLAIDPYLLSARPLDRVA